MNKSEQINALIAYFSGGSQTAFAANLGLKPQSISNWIERNTLDADLIYSCLLYTSPKEHHSPQEHPSPHICISL